MLILLTACIKPDKVPFLKISDSNERLNEYIYALNFWIEKVPEIDKIVFCDNSNSDFNTDILKMKAREYKKQIEFLFFQGDRKAVAVHGKGYGDGEIVDYALSNSHLMATEDEFIKITGRQVVTNMSKICRKMKKGKNYFKCFKDNKKKNVDERLYKVKKDTFNKYLRKVYVLVDDYEGYFIEDVFFDVIKEREIEHDNFPLFPRIRGKSGSLGYTYKENACKTYLYDIRSKFGYYRVN
jgi:hypothetical protein